MTAGEWRQGDDGGVMAEGNGGGLMAVGPVRSNQSSARIVMWDRCYQHNEA